MNVIIKPSKLSGEIVVPPSKSLSHRAIIAASLAKGKSKISNVIINSKPIMATEPIKPSSSPATAKIKSVCGSEI